MFTDTINGSYYTVSVIEAGSVQSLSFSTLPSKKPEIKTQNPIVLPVVLYEHKIWSLPLMEEYGPSVFKNRVQREVYEPSRDTATGEWRLHNKLYNLYSPPNISQVIKSRMRWVGHVAHMGDRRGAVRVLVGKPKERDHLEDLRVDGSITLKSNFKKWDVE
jgi:hypothetical protein